MKLLKSMKHRTCAPQIPLLFLAHELKEIKLLKCFTTIKKIHVKNNY